MPSEVLEKIKSIPAEYSEEFAGYVDEFINKINSEKTQSRMRMSDEETMNLFEYFTGRLNVSCDFDEHREYLEHLDERYGQK